VIVNVENISSNKGLVIASIHNSYKDFPKTPFKKVFSKISNGKSQIVFSDLHHGEYAITVIHDENGNKKMDFNIIHIPKEDAAASNNAKGFMGPPKFSDAVFELKDEIIIQNIRMN
jgi:uncharacterized protein (DUF2141 family)